MFIYIGRQANRQSERCRDGWVGGWEGRQVDTYVDGWNVNCVIAGDCYISQLTV
jgi:hypothetical protein